MNSDADIIIGTEVDTSGVEEGIEDVKDIVEDEDIEIKPEIDTKDVEEKTSKLGSGLSKVLSKGFGKVGKVISAIVKSLSGALLVGVIAVLGAVLVLAAAFSKLKSEDEELNKQWQEIKNTMSNAISQIGSALANIFLPAIQSILNGLKTMIQYIGVILNAWFGIDIYAKKTDKNLKNGVKSAKEMNKQMAGWDEMTILQDNKANGTEIDKTTGMIEPLPEGEVPGWLDWIAQNKDKVIGGILGIVAAIKLLKKGVGGLKAFGIGLAIAGVVIAIQNLIKFLKDPTFENFIGILEGIAMAVLGVAIAIGTWPVALGAAIALMVVLITKHYEEILGFFDNILNWLEGPFTNKMHEIFGPLGDIIIQPILIALEYIKGAFESFYGGIKRMVEGVVNILKGNFLTGIKQVFGGLSRILLAPLNAFISGINSLIKGINKISFDTPDWIPLIGGRHFGFNLPEIPKILLAKGGIVNMPGKGVPIGGAIAGESGRELVLPLQDTQILSEIADAIGRRITINASIVNTMNGRVISKELQKINNESDFAFNR